MDNLDIDGLKLNKIDKVKSLFGGENKIKNKLFYDVISSDELQKHTLPTTIIRFVPDPKSKKIDKIFFLCISSGVKKESLNDTHIICNTFELKNWNNLEDLAHLGPKFQFDNIEKMAENMKLELALTTRRVIHIKNHVYFWSFKLNYDQKDRNIAFLQLKNFENEKMMIIKNEVLTGESQFGSVLRKRFDEPGKLTTIVLKIDNNHCWMPYYWNSKNGSILRTVCCESFKNNDYLLTTVDRFDHTERCKKVYCDEIIDMREVEEF